MEGESCVVLITRWKNWPFRVLWGWGGGGGWLGVQVQNVTNFVVVELIHLSGVGNLGHLTWVKC